jgi:hypothetical protein
MAMAMPAVSVPFMPVIGVRLLVTLVAANVDAEHVAPQRDAQRGALVVAHHRQIELDLFDPGNRPGHPVHLVGQLVSAGPGRDGEGELDSGPTTARLHLAHHAYRPEREVELGIHDGTERRTEL